MCLLPGLVPSCLKLLSWDPQGSDLGGLGVTHEGRARLLFGIGMASLTPGFLPSFLKGPYCSKESQREARGTSPSQGILGSTGCCLDSRPPS